MNPVDRAVGRALDGSAGTAYVGFSGGMDSTVLLDAAARCHDRVVAVHVNHGLMPDAPRWETHCGAVADQLGVGLIVRRVSITRGSNLEARARAARYELFASLLDAPQRCLLLAHHRDDQAETVLLRLVQGRGAYGMPAERPLAAGRLLRPLLELPRSDLAAYARDRRLSWIEDASNDDARQDRNFVRHWVLPVLRSRWGEVDVALARVGTAQREQEAAARALAGDLVAARALPLDALLERPTATARLELLRLWLARRGVALPPGRALAEFLRQAQTAADDRQPVLRLGARALRRHGRSLHLVDPPPELQSAYRVPLPGDLSLPHGILRVRRDPRGFVPRGAVTARFRAGGERLFFGRHRRSVKTLLREAGVPPWQRGRLPLLFDAAGLLAVPGIAHRTAVEAPGAERYRADWEARDAAG